MNGLYQVAGKTDTRKIAEFLSQDGQLLLPFLELICNAEQAVDEVIKVTGKAAVEAILLLSARQVARPQQPGKAKDINWHGWQPRWSRWRAKAADRSTLRRKGRRFSGYHSTPMRRWPPTADCVTSGDSHEGCLDTQLQGDLPEIAETGGRQQVQISREFVAASEEQSGFV